MGYALNMKHKTLVIPTFFCQLVGIENFEEHFIFKIKFA
jgi:hypothetical protein